MKHYIDSIVAALSCVLVLTPLLILIHNSLLLSFMWSTIVVPSHNNIYYFNSKINNNLVHGCHEWQLLLALVVKQHCEHFSNQRRCTASIHPNMYAVGHWPNVVDLRLIHCNKLRWGYSLPMVGCVNVDTFYFHCWLYLICNRQWGCDKTSYLNIWLVLVIYSKSFCNGLYATMIIAMIIRYKILHSFNVFLEVDSSYSSFIMEIQAILYKDKDKTTFYHCNFCSITWKLV